MWQSLFSTPAARRVEKAIAQATEEALDFVGLSHAGHREARTLPLGQQRLVELARALAGKPKVMLLDEPAAGLNIAETQALGELIRRAQVAFGLTIVLVEHDMDLVMEVSHRVTVLCFGEVLACGEPRQIQHDPRVIAAYLGGSS
jgi:ABC-type branched-subunit amino acid transport system ATPase component